jgi:hypothetical protein
MRDITPKKLRCTFGACPAVYELDNDTIVIVGAKPSSELGDALKGKISPDEFAIVVSKQLLANVKAVTETCAE